MNSPNGARSAGPLDPSTYVRHALHGPRALWGETNCYTDHWIELLHTHGMPPEAVLPFVVSADFEGDQWTFFKPSLDELRELYGLRVNELTVWKPLVEHALEHVGAGRYLILDADSFWLPDTHATDYRQRHGKTSIVLQAIDVERQQLGYFHNAGYYVLSGEDFVQTLRLTAAAGPEALPPYAEVVSFDPCFRAGSAKAMREQSRQLWPKHLRRVPATNPIARFARHFEQVLPQLQANGLAYHNAWAFANIRQMGAAFELAANSLQWLGDAECSCAHAAFMAIAQDAQRLIFLGARAVASGKALDPAVQLAAAAANWEHGLGALRQHFGCLGDASPVGGEQEPRR